jgi:diguanylate cyclase (GGDEF)-like protein
LKLILFVGFAVVIASGLTVVLLTEWVSSHTISTMDRFHKVDMEISNLSLKSNTAMINARRNEKDFLLTYNEFGFSEAKSRYIMRVLTGLDDIKENMKNIRILANDSAITQQTQEVEQAIDGYQEQLLIMVEKYGVIGTYNTGLAGAMRGKAHEIENLLKAQENNLLPAGLLEMRRREKDFIERSRDSDVMLLHEAVTMFKTDLAASGLPFGQKEKLRNLTDSYQAMFKQYVKTIEEIRTTKKGYLKSVQTIESVLARLYAYSIAKANAESAEIRKSGKKFIPIKIIAGLLVFIGSIVAALAVSVVIAKSVTETKTFAGQIASGDLTSRLALGGRNEFAALAVALNSMAETLERDITERKQAESQIRFLAYYDGLTGLPNRTFFKELLKRELTSAQRYNLMVALLYLDLDDFKRINDTLGHDMGDILLQAVSKRISGAMRTSDHLARSVEGDDTVVSRLGGDEFVILLHHLNKTYDAGKVAYRILSEISKPFELNGSEVFITASMGISLYPSGGENTDDLFKNADTAMYHAKAKGKNNYQFYSEAMNAAALEVLNMERDLHRALERKEFMAYYQPKVAVSSRKIAGMEALIRWKHKEKGIVSPVEFIPLAEETGLIIPIGEWILFAACQQTKTWQEQGYKIGNIAVNLSARQFAQKNLPGMVERVLNETALFPGHLQLEITESTAMYNPEESIAMLRKLKNIGVQISVDDFGTAYSSLNYLRKLPADSLKIDRSFVIHSATNAADAAIIKGIIALAHSLNLKVIAEGVETEEQFAFLRSVECDEVQGYLFSKPLPAEEFSMLLAKEQF